MKLNDYYSWFQENWHRAGLLIGIILTLFLVVLVFPNNLLLFVLLMYTPLYNFHETEEYIFPGGFYQFVNKNVFKTDPENGPLETKSIFWINMIYVWMGLPIFSLLAILDRRWAAWMPYFFIFQAFVHVGLGIAGKKILNPGMFTSWLIHVPWGIWTIILLMNAKIITNPFFNIYTLIGFLINGSLPLIVGPIILARYKNRIDRKKLNYSSFSK
jgi:Protein of unknown function with HXXEE motif